MDERKSIATVHNLLFTILTLGLLCSKTILVFQGQSATPNMLDWVYSIVVALVFYWLGEYNKMYPLKHQWYFKKGVYWLVVDMQRRLLTYSRRRPDVEYGSGSRRNSLEPAIELASGIEQPVTSQNLRRRQVRLEHRTMSEVGSSPIFTGREDFLERLRDYFRPGDRPQLPQQRKMYLLYGTGGVGKSQISFKFIEECSEWFWRIFTINATSRETIMRSFQDIAKDFNSPESGMEESTEFVLLRLSQIEKEWLLVFDGADGDPDLFLEFLPQGYRGNILFTSRNPEMRRYMTQDASVEVVEMEKEDTVSLLLKSSLLDESSTELRRASYPIVAELCFLPLAVDQAGAAIASGLCDIHDYLGLYSKHRQELSHHSPEVASVYGTFNVSFTQIKARAGRRPNLVDAQAAENAISILQIFAFLHHDNIMDEIFKRAAEVASKNPSEDESQKTPDLPFQLLHLDMEGSWDQRLFNEGIGVLLSFSLVKRGASHHDYALHPLVHSCSRDNMTSSEQLTNCHYAKALLSGSITFRFAFHDYVFRRALVPHIKACYEHAAAVGIARSYNDEEFENFALVFQENGYFLEAEELRVQVMEMRKTTLGDEHPNTLTSIHNLASTYSHQGRWTEAEALQIRVVDTMKRILGPEHPDTLTSISDLASTFSNQGRWEEAEELEVQVAEMMRGVLGSEHPDTLTSFRNLASTYRKEGRWNEAERLEVQAIETSEKVLGAEHPNTLTSIRNLASTYFYQGRLAEAEALQIRVVDTMKRILGPEHPDTLTSINNLASTYSEQGRWSDAEVLQIQVMDAMKMVLGPEHPGTLTSISNLASTFSNQGRWEEAEELEVQVMKTTIRVLGAEHPDTLASMGNLALTYWDQGRWKEAEELELQAMEMTRRVLGPEHPDTLATIGNLGMTYWKQGRWKDAEVLQIQVMDAMKKVLGSEHPSTLTSMHNLASTYRSQGRWKDAEELEGEVE